MDLDKKTNELTIKITKGKKKVEKKVEKVKEAVTSDEKKTQK